MDNRIVAWWATNKPIIRGIFFYCLMLIFFTANLVTRVLKPNVASNISGLVSDTVLISFVITALFAFCFAMAFESMSVIFILNGKHELAKRYALASGLFALFGLLMLIPPDIDYATIQGFATVVVYLLIGFLPPIANYHLTDLLYYKLSIKMEDGKTMLEVIQENFLQDLRAYYSKDKEKNKPKENRFMQVFNNLAGRSPNQNTTPATYAKQEPE